jgi:hypothetical protein
MPAQLQKLPEVLAKVAADNGLPSTHRLFYEDPAPDRVDWHLRLHGRGTLTLGLDYLGAPVNLLSRIVLTELDGQIEAIAANPPKALILRTGTPRLHRRRGRERVCRAR